MSYAFVQQKDNSDATGTPMTTFSAGAFGANPTAANLLRYVVNYNAAALKTCAITDTLLNGFTEIGSHFDAGLSQAWHWGYAKNITGGSADTVLATFGAAVQFPAIYVAEYSGFDTSAPFTTGETAFQLQLGPGTATDAVSSGNTPTLSAQPAALVGFTYNNSSALDTNAGTGFTPRAMVWTFGSSATSRPEDKRLTALTAVAATATITTGTDQVFTIAVVFKESGSIATLPPGSIYS